MPPAGVSEKTFYNLVSRRATTLLAMADYISHNRSSDKIFIRPLLGELLSQSMQIEELLDTYDARNNCRWCAFRSLIASVKCFSDIGYELLHISHSLPDYQLVKIDQDFLGATNRTVEFITVVLLRCCDRLIKRAKELEIPIPHQQLRETSYVQELPKGRLPHDCRIKKTESVSETVTLLATAFLNLAAESEKLHSSLRIDPAEYQEYIQSTATEEKLRGLQLRFHNLQSMYDTYVSGSEAEALDQDLPRLRGHISVVLHLLKTAVLFAHYYERHINTVRCAFPGRRAPVLSSEELFNVLVTYSLSFASQYIVAAEKLCREMLNRYREVTKVTVPVPVYRGFHVRPSTLISKLVLHYGSEVVMRLDDQDYDAGSSLELFRVNEKINARKRQWLVQEINRLELVPEAKNGRSLQDIIRGVLLNLEQRNKVKIYKHPLRFSNQPVRKNATLFEAVSDEISKLLAMGKIDINLDVKVEFIGDKRVLSDIKLLAESGYGEDSLGNNVPLPKKLEYLRK
jgi:hypothetical protein